ncbi:hypothetical protein [Tardiphaga sp. 839_C3_N1_4]|jgi:hypothetical protein|uniref:hypothetical protein n=1 Tax=Tardiphaga sp. 839_C3_N1_4 TaxID=3240761 RepID=UPI003F20E6D3
MTSSSPTVAIVKVGKQLDFVIPAVELLYVDVGRAAHNRKVEIVAAERVADFLLVAGCWLTA